MLTNTTSQDWGLRAFLGKIAKLSEVEKETCFQVLNDQGYTTKRRAFFNLTDTDLQGYGIEPAAVRDELLLAIGQGTTSAGAPSLPRKKVGLTARLGSKSKAVSVSWPPKYEQLCEVFEEAFPDLKDVQYELQVAARGKSNLRTIISSDEGSMAYLVSRRQTDELSLMAVSSCMGFGEFDLPSSSSYLGLAPMWQLEDIRIDDSKFEDGDISKYDGDYSALLTHLALDYRRRIQVFGPLVDVQDITAREFISPLLLAAALIVKGVHLRAEYSITGLLGKGPVDYVALYEGGQVPVTEAKKENFRTTYPLSMAQMAASRDECVRNLLGKKRKFSEVSELNSLPSSSIITSGDKWVFLRYEQQPPRAEGRPEQQQPVRPRLFKSAYRYVSLTDVTSEEELHRGLDRVLKKIVGIFQLQIEASSIVKKRKATT